MNNGLENLDNKKFLEKINKVLFLKKPDLKRLLDIKKTPDECINYLFSETKIEEEDKEIPHHFIRINDKEIPATNRRLKEYIYKILLKINS